MMRNLLKTGLLAIFLMTGTTACAQILKTNMLVTVLDAKGNVQRGATVKVYETEDDYDEDKNVVASMRTDEKGQAKFKKLKSQSYFIRAEKGEMSNEDGATQTGALAEKKMNKVNVIIEGLPDIR